MEPVIKINNFLLTEAQAMTLRVALQTYIMFLIEKGLGEDETGKAIRDGYLARAGEIQGLMLLKK